MKWRSWAAGLAAVLAAGPAFAAPAVARPEAPDPVWLYTTCSTGQITGAAYDEAGLIVLTGTTELCQPMVAQFTVVPFWPDTSVGIAVANQLVLYAPVGQTTAFRATLTADATRAEGICLMASPRRRMDCVTVAAGTDGGLVLAPAPADSPAWTERVFLATRVVCEIKTPDGICGSCVGVSGGPVEEPDGVAAGVRAGG